MVISGVPPPMVDALRRVRRRRSGTRLWTCCAGRAGTRIRSEALHRILTIGRPAADRAGARPISIYLIIALSARSCYDLRVTPSRSLIEDDWPVIRRLLPDDLEQSAREHGAMRRRRGQVNSAEQLLRLILMHVAGGLSLEQTVTRAQARGLATLNAMALHKRLCTSRRWLEALTGHLLADIKPHLRQNEDCWGIGRRVRILDATDIQEPGSTGSDWRIHYSLRLPEMCCDFFELSDYHGAESLRRLPVEPGDLVLVDRGYNDRKAVGQILECGGELIMRYNSGAFPLLNSAGQPLDPLKELRPLKIGEVGEWEVRFVSH